MTLKSLVEKNDTTAGRVFDLLIQSLIVLSLISFSIETLPNLGSKTTMWLKRAETITVIIFSIEYALRVFAAQRKFKFIFSFYGLETSEKLKQIKHRINFGLIFQKMRLSLTLLLTNCSLTYSRYQSNKPLKASFCSFRSFG